MEGFGGHGRGFGGHGGGFGGYRGGFGGGSGPNHGWIGGHFQNGRYPPTSYGGGRAVYMDWPYYYYGNGYGYTPCDCLNGESWSECHQRRIQYGCSRYG